MKALTICQPYAHLITIGEKLVENRTWNTHYRGPLAIHAGKSRAWMDPWDEQKYPNLVFGAVIATAELYDVVPMSRLPKELCGHEHAFGPFCWCLRNVSPLFAPEYCAGKVGLWEWDTTLFSGTELGV